LAELTAFVSEQDNAVWAEQIQQDAASGKLDFLFQEAEDERELTNCVIGPRNSEIEMHGPLLEALPCAPNACSGAS
jgi:hypothetical protein